MPNQINSPKTEPPSFEKRLPLALGLMMVVLLASQYFFKPAPSPKPVQSTTPRMTTKESAPPPSSSAAAAPLPAGHVEGTAETPTEIDTDLYKIRFTNKGAAVTSWVLKKYKNEDGKPLQLINQQAVQQNLPLPFTIQIAGGKLPFDPNSVLYATKIDPDGLGIDFTYSNGNVTVEKDFHFGRSTYLTDIKSSVRNGSALVPFFLMWRGGFGDERAFRAATTQTTVRYDASDKKLITKTPKDAKDGPITAVGDEVFAGVEDKFFAMLALPPNGVSTQVRTFSDDLRVPGEDKPVAYIGVGISTGDQNDFSLFAGPKDVDLLRKVNPKLSQLIDWGFFEILAKPLFLWMNWTYDHWTLNYGWAIIVMTIIINVALFPLRISSLKSARKMQKIQPKVKAINEKYKNIKINDPRKAEQNQEVMALYKSEGINPVGGCLPMLIQLPFLYAFYRVLSISIELRHSPWMWVSDLSAPEALPIHLLPIVLIATSFLSQRMTPAAGVDPNQQKMMALMPLMMGVFFYQLPSGLVLYYLTGNLVGIGLQLLINKTMPTPPAAAPALPVAASSGKGPVIGKGPVKKTVRK